MQNVRRSLAIRTRLQKTTIPPTIAQAAAQVSPPIAEPDWIYDPSGYVFEAVESNRIDGVTATLLQQSADGTSWSVWNADRYLQQNPIQTDGDGRYAWDVPEGNWQVKYTKDGYDAAKSDVLTVLPPHFDVNIALVSRQAPHVTGVLQTQNKDGFLLSFSKYMLPGTLTTDAIHLNLVGGAEEVQVTSDCRSRFSRRLTRKANCWLIDTRLFPRPRSL